MIINAIKLGILIPFFMPNLVHANNDSCQITFGADVSTSSPWVGDAEVLTQATNSVVTTMEEFMNKGSILVGKTFGSFYDKSTSNRALLVEEIQIDNPNMGAIQRQLMHLIMAAGKDQQETSIIGFLHNLPMPMFKYRKHCAIVLLTDGYEHSEYGTTAELANGLKKIPVPEEGYLNGVPIIMIGFGVTTDEGASSTRNTKLKSAWKQFAKDAGATIYFLNW